MKSYNYQDRKGVKEIPWEEFQKICQNLAEQVAKENFDLIIGVAKDGLFPATIIAGMLRKELYPVRVSRRENDIVVYDKPTWRVDIPDITGKKVLVVDDISSSGNSLETVKKRAFEKGAIEVRTCVLTVHSFGDYKPDFVGLESDDLVIFPWHTKILVNGDWQLHPELAEAVDKYK